MLDRALKWFSDVVVWRLCLLALTTWMEGKNWIEELMVELMACRCKFFKIPFNLLGFFVLIEDPLVISHDPSRTHSTPLSLSCHCYNSTIIWTLLTKLFSHFIYSHWILSHEIKGYDHLIGLKWDMDTIQIQIYSSLTHFLRRNKTVAWPRLSFTLNF